MKKSSKLSKTLNKKKARDWFIIKFEFNILELPLKPKIFINNKKHFVRNVWNYFTI